MSEIKVPLVYQDIAEEMSFESLPTEWLQADFTAFSENKSLFDYQESGLKNGLTLLYHYFGSLKKYNPAEGSGVIIERKKSFFEELRNYEEALLDSLGISNNSNKILFKKLKQYYPIVEAGKEERIQFLHFVNRMSFWMATGSGKTLILVKLIELLDKLKSNSLIPDNDILILTHRDDLVEQIVRMIQEFNHVAYKKIRIWELTRFEEVKRGAILAFREDINVFIYRSDLIAEETKEKQIGFEDIENGGKWYLLLDEAHKGDKEDSKRQLYYSLLTRNGFLFNFSATFTDPWDILTTVYNFNLDAFIREGYGKNVYLSEQELTAFKNRTDFNDEEKKNIVLKTLFLFTLSKRAKDKINASVGNRNYHKPLLVSLVNSVNVQDSDLEIFFKVLEEIATENIDSQLFDKIKGELAEEFMDNPRYMFGNDRIRITKETIEAINLRDVRKSVFHTERTGSIEVKKIPGNDKELIFKLKTADLPFALMRIADCGKWVKKKLVNYDVEETYDNESYFKHLDENSNNINLLRGSRAFYEGWDSNRPNVMLFINIGRGDAKKYVIQSIGRGVRIEPIKNKRKRLLPLRRENDPIAQEMSSRLDQVDVSIMETLFVLGTNRKSLEQVLEGIIYESKTSGEVIELKENPLRAERSLLVPVYKERSKGVLVDDLPKFEGNRVLLKTFVEWVDDDRVFYAMYSNLSEVKPSAIRRVKEFLDKGSFLKNEKDPAFYQLSKLINHVNIKLRELDRFCELTEEIVHFKKIRVDLPEEERGILKAKIERVCTYEDVGKKELALKKQFTEHKIDLDTYTEELKKLTKSSAEEAFSADDSTLRIKNMINHYYIPLMVSEKEKIDYINHIVSVKSERVFLEQLEAYISSQENQLKKFDWWMFSKLDEHLDEIHIPYYNKTQNRIDRFKPDFVFWLKKDSDYHILFVDPKGTTHTDYQFKVDGYRFIFEKNNDKKVFSVNGDKVRVHLFLFTEDCNKLAEGYKRYWFDDFEKMITQFLS